MGTELFKVTCVTCKASLSVRNPALIDQIVACPKCDSMVHVASPTATAPTATAPLVTPLDAAAPVVAPPSFDEPFTSPPESPAVTTTPDAPSLPTLLEVGSSSNFIMWAVGSFVVGVTLMGTFLILRGGGESETTPPQAREQSAYSEVAATSVATSVDERGAESPPPSPSPGTVADRRTQDENSSVEPAKVESQPVEPSLLGPVEQPGEDPITDATPTSDEEPITPPQDEPIEKLVIQAADEPREARKFDPLTMDPEELNLADMTEAAAGGDQTDEDAEKLMDEDQPAEARPMNAVVPVRVAQQSGGGSANHIATIQLKREFPAIAVKDMPLLDFLTLTSQLAGVPVSVGPEQLQMAGVTPGRPVSVDLQGASLAEVLQSVLEPLHLEVTTEGPQVVIVRQDAAKLRNVDYPVDDLLGGKMTAADIGKWIEQLIAPESWQAAGGAGKITTSGASVKIDQTQAIQYQVLFFLERVRLAKGLPLRSKYPARLLSGKPYLVGIADRLNAPATFTFSHNTPLAEVFQYWQSESGLPIFVDWPALASVGLWPDLQITCTSANERWQTAFDKILGPLDLAWRAAPGGAIQITSRGRAETEPVVEIYPIGGWQRDAANAIVIDDQVHVLTYVRAPAVAHK